MNQSHGMDRGKGMIGRASLFTCLVGVVALWAASPQDDTLRSQSPTRPAPDWLKLVDLGAKNPELAGYLAPEGISVEIVAREPVTINPVGMIFTPDGTPIVAEWPVAREQMQKDEVVTYSDGTTRRNTTMAKSETDVIKRLIDSNGDGIYDQSETILTDTELPSSMLLEGDSLYLSGRGSIFRHSRTQPDGPWDRKEEMIRGFCGFHHHQASGMTIGPDGLLYITSGDNDNYPEGPDGSRVVVLRTGVVVRCGLDGTRLEEFARGFRNPYRDAVFDPMYNLFHVDNDNEDGSKFMGCRLLHIVEGADYGWRLYEGAVCCRPDHERGAVNGELPGKLGFMLKTGRGAPAGLLLLHTDTFPDHYQGLALYPDVYRKSIRAYRWRATGATFEVFEEFEFLKSEDPLFRPCQCILGPDGAIYVVDWRTDSGGAGRLWGDGQHGRIYRIRWSGTEADPARPLRPMDRASTIASASDADLLAILNGPNFAEREWATRELVRRGKQTELLTLLADSSASESARMHALAAQFPLWNKVARDAVLAASRDPSPNLRRLAVDWLGRRADAADAQVAQRLTALVADPEPAVARQAALASARLVGDTAYPEVRNRLNEILSSGDPFLIDGFVRAVERMGTPALDRLAAEAEGSDRAVVLDLFSRFRERPAFEAAQRLMANETLTPAERAGVVRSLLNYQLDPPVSSNVLVAMVNAGNLPKEVLLAGLDVIAVVRPSQPAELDGLLLQLLQSPDAEVRRRVLVVVRALGLAEVAKQLVSRLDEESIPAEERLEMLRVIRDLRVASAADSVSRMAKGVQNLALRLEAMRALPAIDGARGEAMLNEALESTNLSVLQEAISQLGSRPEGARMVAERFLAGKLPKDALPSIAEALRKHSAGQKEMEDLLAQVLKSGLLIELGSDEAKRVEALVADGDPVAGRNLYADATRVQCMTCHRLENVGNSEGAGPALTRLWDTHSVPKILESILEPSKEIKEGYQTYIVADAEGRVLTGLLKSKNDREVVLKDEKGVDHRLSVGDIEEMKASDVSLMPAGVAANLSFNEFVNLIAFLKSRPAQEGLKQYPGVWWVAGPFPGGLETPQPPESLAFQMDVTKRIEPDQGLSFHWQPTAPDVSGTLDVRRLLGRDDSSAYALAHLATDQDRTVTAELGGDNVLVWLNGEPIPAASTIRLPLKAGINRLLIKSATATGEAKGEQKFVFRLVDEDQVRFPVRPE